VPTQPCCVFLGLEFFANRLFPLSAFNLLFFCHLLSKNGSVMAIWELDCALPGHLVSALKILYTSLILAVTP
jgi:hypothetical protein